MGFGLKSLVKGGGKLFKDVIDLSLSPFTALLPGDPKYPPLPEERVMPVGDEAEKRRAKRRQMAARLARGGRASTMLSQRETLG